MLAWLQLYRTHSKAKNDAAFCRLTGIAPSTFNSYKRDRTPGVDLLEALRRTFGADLNDIVDRQPTAADEAELRRILAALAAAHDNAPGLGRRKTANG
jgi:transcriptional regulator with XRE-family HTH domain